MRRMEAGSGFQNRILLQIKKTIKMEENGNGKEKNCYC